MRLWFDTAAVNFPTNIRLSLTSSEVEFKGKIKSRNSRNYWQLHDPNIAKLIRNQSHGCRSRVGCCRLLPNEIRSNDTLVLFYRHTLVYCSFNETK